MTAHIISADNQLTLSKDVLDHLGVRAGDKLEVDRLPGGRIQLLAARKGKISDTFGVLKRKIGKSLSIDEMNEIIAQGWAGKR
jgi:hypothetical protein